MGRKKQTNKDYKKKYLSGNQTQNTIQRKVTTAIKRVDTVEFSGDVAFSIRLDVLGVSVSTRGSWFIGERNALFGNAPM